MAHTLVAALLQRPLDPTLILNVNVPDLPYEALAGYRGTRLGFRHRSEAVMPARDPRGQSGVLDRTGRRGQRRRRRARTSWRWPQGFVSVTPLSIDFTRHAALPEVGALAGAL